MIFTLPQWGVIIIVFTISFVIGLWVQYRVEKSLKQLEKEGKK